MKTHLYSGAILRLLNGGLRRLIPTWCAIAMIFCGVLPTIGHAQPTPPGGGGDGFIFPTNLDSWSFSEAASTNFLSDKGYAPVSFTNIDLSKLGDIMGGFSLIMDSTNAAWLQYHSVEADGTTNLTIDSGTIVLWVSPNWASATTNNNGSGPGVPGRLIEVGSYTTNASYGWWSLFVDSGGTNLYFAAQTNSGDGAIAMYLSAPIDWATNDWHMIALTYSPTNSALYIDGQLATNGLAVTVLPGPNVLTNGFWIGSDSSGVLQSHAEFDDISSYNYPLDGHTVEGLYGSFWGYYMMNPYNIEPLLHSAPSSPGYPAGPSPWSAISGSGYLTPIATNSIGCVTSGDIWATNITAFTTNGAMAVTFTIGGGSDGVLYDVFANAALDFSTSTNMPWSWMGQGYHCVTYTITNLPSMGSCFLMLGKPTDTDGDGLSDAYEKLVSKTDPYKYDTDGDGMFDGWELAHGLNPLVNNQPYTPPATTLTIIKPTSNTQVQ